MNLTPILFSLNILLLLLLSVFAIVSNSFVQSLPGYDAGPLPFKLETGYVGVGEAEDVQLFYYFVESERNPKDDPLVLWLSGGPGCSALRAFFYEIGPLVFNYANSNGTKSTLELNPYSWTKFANVIFLDQPVGTGFSYAKTEEASKTSDTLSSTQTYNFLRKVSFADQVRRVIDGNGKFRDGFVLYSIHFTWFMNNPRFLSNPLYICGGSYEGIGIPIIVQLIYNGNEVGSEPELNIKGYVIGNPLTDKNSDFNSRIQFAHRMAILSDELYESVKTNCHGDYTGLHSTDLLCINDLQRVDKCNANINFVQILEPLCSSLTSRQNLLKWEGSPLQDINPILSEASCQDDTQIYSKMWANDRTVQKALKIRKGTVTEWENCNPNTFYTFGAKATVSYSFDVLNSAYYHQNLTLKSCRALIYSGDHDMVVPYLGTEKWIRSLNLTVKNEWEPWFLGSQVAGFTVSFSHNDYSLTFATVKGAGHIVTDLKPKESLAMVERWFSNNPL